MSNRGERIVMRNKPMGLMERASRTILDIKTALALTAKRHGINTIAGKYGFHPQQLYNNLNVNDPDRAPTLAQFELITEFARDHDDHQQILDALSRVTGCLWIPIPDAEDGTVRGGRRAGGSGRAHVPQHPDGGRRRPSRSG